MSGHPLRRLQQAADWDDLEAEQAAMAQEGFVAAAKALRRPAPTISESSNAQKRDVVHLDAPSASPAGRSLPNGGKKSRFATQMAEQRERAAAATREHEMETDGRTIHDQTPDDEHGVPVVLSRIYEREVIAAPRAPELRTTAFPAAAHRSEAGAPSLGRKVDTSQSPSWARRTPHPSTTAPETEDEVIDRENRQRCALCT